MISITVETPDEFEAIRTVTVDAFANSELGHNGEADLVDLLRSECDEVLSLVARSGRDVVGHILFSPVTIDSAGPSLQGMGIGPMSVATDRQRTGIGTLLMETGLRRLTDAGCPFVAVFGHRDYYSRFGFVPASRYNVMHGFSGLPQDAFFINMLMQDTLQSSASSTAHYRAEFGPQ